MMVDIPQFQESAFSLGFVETEAAGFFRWYEFPSSRDVREGNLPAFVRAMFYAPRSELQIWVNLRGLGMRDRMGAVVFEGYVESLSQLNQILTSAIRHRNALAVDQLIRHADDRLESVPRDLVDQARSPRQDVRLNAELVIADWLLEHGIPF